MMKKHNGTKRGFIWSSKAWYADAANCEHEVNFGMYENGNGTTGEMHVEWVDLGLARRAPQLQVFDDGWSALALFTDLIQKMGEVDNDNITEAEFVKLLKSCGFEDMTPYDSPYEVN